MIPLRSLAALLCLASPLALFAEEKKEEPPKPAILTAAPLGASPGVKTTVVFWGRALADVGQVSAGDVSAELKIIEKKPFSAPSKELTAKLGDSETTVEIALPADFTAPAIALTFTSPAGTTEAFMLPVSPADKTVAEIEPNNGYAQAQAIALGQTVLGSIHEKQNVDVYAFSGKAGQNVVIDASAAQLGSAVDTFLTLVARDGQRILALNDDASTNRDSRIEATLPTDGEFLVVVQDANDAGGQGFSYRLSASVAP